MPRKKITPQVPGTQQAPAEALPPEQAVDDGLPDAADIDPTKITRRVLTRQGVVVPTKAFTPPRF